MPRRSSRGERASAACPGHARLRDAQPGSSTDEEQPPMTTSFTAALRESARPTWDRAVGHRFVTELHERSEEHTSELQSRGHLVCRLLLEKKKQRHGGTSVLQ